METRRSTTWRIYTYVSIDEIIIKKKKNLTRSKLNIIPIRDNVPLAFKFREKHRYVEMERGEKSEEFFFFFFFRNSILVLIVRENCYISVKRVVKLENDVIRSLRFYN